MAQISATEVAKQRIRTFLNKRGKGIGVRLKVVTHGCSGFAYKLEFVDDIKGDDQVFSDGDDDIKIIVDAKSIKYLDGTLLDYTKEGLQEGFKFNNPQVKGSCGCGESFTI